MLHTKRSMRLLAVIMALCLCVFSGNAQEPQEVTTEEQAQEVIVAEADQAQETVTEEEQVTEPATPVGRTVSAVRYGPCDTAMVIGRLENGTKLTVLGTNINYFIIDFYGMTGYIRSEQVKQNEAGEYYVSCQEGSSETKVMQTYFAEDALELRGQIRDIALQYIGVPYVSGGTSPWGFDCSGLSQYVFAQAGVHINRTVATQLDNGVTIEKEDLQCGDLVIFQNTTGWGKFASHVGIYIGNDQILHAATFGVSIMGLYSSYTTEHYQCAIRVIMTDASQEAVGPVGGVHNNISNSYWRESSQTDLSGNFFVSILESRC